MFREKKNYRTPKYKSQHLSSRMQNIIFRYVLVESEPLEKGQYCHAVMRVYRGSKMWPIILSSMTYTTPLNFTAKTFSSMTKRWGNYLVLERFVIPTFFLPWNDQTLVVNLSQN